ncbi:MAG: hypothetical protein HYX87_04230 [Chloroflexi bacterium]|nr:hypothetical protein [Chloroflexota bacterium]
MFQSVGAARVIFILGILNFLTLLFISSSCRCLPMSRVGKNLLKNHYYQRFYKFHCYLWYILGASVVIHASLAIMYAGIPF